ncbi:MAG: SAM-dependent methyltransferase, partial [Chloroflexi bacterium]|nr:SAM-dependent methyltransferase [Chloroflexota bacterium]
MTSETSAASEAEKTPDALVARLFEQSLAMLDVMSVYVGDQLGLYRSLHDGGPATTAELASRAGIDARYAREWLDQQAATGFLEVDDVAAAADQRRYLLPEAHVEALLNLESPYSITPLTRSMVACGKVMPQLLEAYRTGGGVDWSEYGPDMIEAQGDFNRPWLVNSFGSE